MLENGLTRQGLHSIMLLLKSCPMALKEYPGSSRIHRREENRCPEVHVKEGESLDSALKRFKRSCAKAGVLAEVRRRECYESPSVKRRKKSEAARKNRNKRYY